MPETVRSTAHLARPVLIVNTHSRRGKDESIHARERLRSLGVSLTGHYALDRAAELNATVHKAISSGATLIILGGRWIGECCCGHAREQRRGARSHSSGDGE